MKTLWDVIKESRTEENISSIEQYKNLESIYSNLDDKTLLTIADSWFSTQLELDNSKEFNKLHVEHGGIVEGGDDTFYEDFACWVIAQGEELYNAFKENGANEVINYISNNNIDYSEYTFENMKYAIPDHIYYDYNERKHKIKK